jgi:hypothetical protein
LDQVMRLQRAVLRPGARVRVVGVHDPPPALQSCLEEGVLLACLEEGTFECVVELWCGHGSPSAHRPVGARVPVQHLLPAGECGIDPWPVCTPSAPAPPAAGSGSTEQQDNGGISVNAWPSADVALPVGAGGVGRLIAASVQLATQLEASGRMPHEMIEMGETAFPDL